MVAVSPVRLCHSFFEEKIQNEENKYLENYKTQVFEEKPVGIAYFVLPLRENLFSKLRSWNHFSNTGHF